MTGYLTKDELAPSLVTELELINTVNASVNAHMNQSSKKHKHSSGSNANGSWIKFDDGTLVCRCTMTLNGWFSTAVLNNAWTFPAQFVNSNIQVISTLNELPQLDVKYRDFVVISKATNATTASISAVSKGASVVNGDLVSVNVIALGGWK